MEPNYTESQDELYEGCGLLATSMEEELAQLAAFKAKYDLAFVTAFRSTIQAAIDLPDDEQRSVAHEILRIKMVKGVNEDVREALNSLRLYIRDAFPAEDREVRWKEAGFNDFPAAMKYNWEKLKTILKKSNDFITNHLAVLTANNNMPPAFQLLIANMKAQTDISVTNLLNLRENSKQGTQDKLIANNELNRQKNLICEDGQHVFRNDEAKRAQFVWESIMDLVSPPGLAGLKFDAKEAGTNNPINEAEGKFQKPGGTIITAKTGPDGKAYITSLEPGKYTGTIEHPAYDTLNVEFEITTGVTSFKHWLLIPKV